MNILVIGGGGREHALCFALRKSKKTERLYCLPGNAGIAEVAECVDLGPLNNSDKAIAKFCNEKGIRLVVVGPEAPLVNGLVDYLEDNTSIRVFGPRSDAAELEGSKKFMKDIASKYGIPTAEYKSFTDAGSAKKFIREFGKRVVVKASGLAAGKGVLIPETTDEAIKAVDDAMNNFGEAGKTIVVEEFMEGEEASFFAICDGKDAIAFGSAQDHKRVGDGDTGPNTGGMGTYSPAPIVTKDVDEKVMKKIIIPTIKGMEKEGKPFKGFLFAGLMIKDGEPKLIEFNIRFGDPEAQSLMLRLESDLVELLFAAADGKITGHSVKLSDKSAMCVVMAANGYPGDYKKGTEIKNLDKAATVPGAVIFHAGTKKEGEKILANGGRVLGVSAVADTLATAKEIAYKAVDLIDWKDGFCRRDIGWRAIGEAQTAKVKKA